MPTQREHRMKYQENRMILDSLFDCSISNHCNWITTISFYTALHIIEYEFAKENVDCKSHSEREEKMRESEKFSKNIIGMYKQMGTNSRVARYKERNISPTVANQMLNYLKKIEQEFGFPKIIN